MRLTTTISIAALAASFSACTDDTSETKSLQVTETETTRTNGSETTVERRVFEYQGNRLTAIRYFVNGEQAGRRELTYTGKQIGEILTFDRDGDRATETWTYSQGRLERQLVTVSDAYTRDIRIEYGKRHLPKEVVSTLTDSGDTDTETTYTRSNTMTISSRP